MTTMPIAVERLRPNAWGRYYVTADCNGCGLCAFLAPVNFAPDADRSYFAVLHQPSGPVELDDVRAALDACPLHCIHDDGDE